MRIEEGNIVCAYLPEQTGDYQINLTFEGKPIGQSPYTVHIAPQIEGATIAGSEVETITYESRSPDSCEPLLVIPPLEENKGVEKEVAEISKQIGAGEEVIAAKQVSPSYIFH